MASPTLDIPVFDADNHLYETKDALTKFLPDRYKGAVDYVEVRGRTKIVIKGTISEYIPNPTFDVVARPGAQEDYFRNGNPEGKNRREIFGEPMRAIPAFREPGARIELMDEQGIDRALMFPTLASLVEERMRDDPELIHAVIHALNEWMHETWQFDYEEPHLHHAGRSPCPSSSGPSRSSSGSLERGAKAVLIRPAPVPGLPGPALVRPARVRPVLGEGASSTTSSSPCTPPTAATSATPTSGWAATARCCRSSPQAFRMLSPWRPIEDAVSALVCHGALSRFPKLKVAVDRERQQLGRAAAQDTWPTSTRRCPRTSSRTRSRCIKRNIYISPFWEEDLGALGRAHRRRPRAVRLRLPAPRGPGRPGQLRRRARRASPRRPSARSWAATWPG